MRINKFVSISGQCSRREADRLIEAGRVSVNGETATMGMQVESGMTVLLDGTPLMMPMEKTYLKVYKPIGIVCTSDPREKNNIIDFVHAPIRITYAGRLDRNSEGLLLLTNDGDLIEALMRSAGMHEKEYEVTLSRLLTTEELHALESGVYLKELKRMTLPCHIVSLQERTYRFILTQGMNRQIRRMCALYGIGVHKLKRVRIATLELGDLLPGEVRDLTQEEIEGLQRCVRSTKEDRGESPCH